MNFKERCDASCTMHTDGRSSAEAELPIVAQLLSGSASLLAPAVSCALTHRDIVRNHHPCTQIAAPHSTPLFTASVRLIPSGAAVVAWAASKGKRWPATRQAWLAISVFALVDGALFQGFLAEGLQRVPAGVGSVLIDSQPLTVAVAAALLFGESLSLAGVFGLVLGICGLVLLEVPPDTLSSWAHLDSGAPSSCATACLCKRRARRHACNTLACPRCGRGSSGCFACVPHA